MCRNRAALLGLLWPALANAQAEVTVRGERKRPEAAATTLGAEAARRSAGTQGDPVKALEQLPGAARTGPAESGLVVWGSAPGETRIYLDGIELPWLFHGSGIRSVVPAGVLKTLTLVPGAYAVDHGRGLGGLVLLETRDPTDRFRYSVHADLLDAGALVAVPFGSGSAAEIAGRYGYLDQWLPRVTDQDVGRLYTVPAYYDYYSRAAIAGVVSLQFFGSHDAYEREAPSSDRSANVREEQDREFQRVALRYATDDGSVLAYVGADADSRSAQTGTAGWSLATRSKLYGLRAERRERVAASAALAFGLDVLGTLTEVERSGTLTLPAREGDPFVFGAVPGSDFASDSYETHTLNVAPYAEVALEWSDLRVTPGVRLSAFLIGSDHLRPAVGRVPPLGRSAAFAPVEPRLRVDYAASSRVGWFAAVGRYHQAPQAPDLSAVFGNPELGLSSATQASAGEWIRFEHGLDVEIVGFAKWLAELPVRSASRSPETARVLVPTGEGRIYGTQLALQRSLRHGWSGGVAWTISRSERRDGPGSSFRRFDRDQPHVISATLAKRLENWSFAALARYASGSPRTPVTRAFYNASLGRYEPLFGAPNSERLPDFYELDLRVDRRFALGEATELWVYLEGLNVTFHEHAEEIVYSADFRDHDFLTGLPPLISAGLRLER